MNRLRIIAGEWRSRPITFIDAEGLRPTPARVRETLFNWLRLDVAGARCLDLFAGSGALAFEAASRGAESVVLVDSNPRVCAVLQENALRLGAERVTVVRSEALRFLIQGTERPFDLVFLDPPFGRGMIEPCCQRLTAGDWLSAGAKVYVESEKAAAGRGIPRQWMPQRSRVAGDVAYAVYQYREDE